MENLQEIIRVTITAIHIHASYKLYYTIMVMYMITGTVLALSVLVPGSFLLGLGLATVVFVFFLVRLRKKLRICKIIIILYRGLSVYSNYGKLPII